MCRGRLRAKVIHSARVLIRVSEHILRYPFWVYKKASSTMEKDQDLFDKIIEFNEIELTHPDEELDSEIMESEYAQKDALELGYALATVTQQINGLVIDFFNGEKPGWMDDKSAILLRDLNDLCEQIIDRMYENDCDECDDGDC